MPLDARNNLTLARQFVFTECLRIPQPSPYSRIRETDNVSLASSRGTINSADPAEPSKVRPHETVCGANRDPLRNSNLPIASPIPMRSLHLLDSLDTIFIFNKATILKTKAKRHTPCPRCPILLIDDSTTRFFGIQSPLELCKSGNQGTRAQTRSLWRQQKRGFENEVGTVKGYTFIHPAL